MKLCFVLIAAILWSSHGSGADKCSTIDLSEDLGGTWDQIDTSWCHAFATTDSLTKHLRNKGVLKKGERLHPLQIAAAGPLVDGHSVVKSTDRLGTMIGDMVSLSEEDLADEKRINDGLCREEDLKPHQERARALFNEDWRIAVQMFASRSCASSQSPCGPMMRAVQFIQKSCDELAMEEAHYWSKLFRKSCRLAWPDWYAQYYYHPGRIQGMQSGRTLEPSSPRIDEKMKANIDAALESNELAAIGYDVSFLRKVPSKRPESHWSTVAGRKRGPDGKCYYLLRNSWGPDCRFYKRNAKCVKGWLTIPEDQLLPRVHTVHYFKD